MSDNMEYADHLFNQLQEANARLTAAQAENEALRRELDKVRGKLSGWRDRFRREYAKGGGHDSWLLRKQAEAADECLHLL